MSGHFDGRVALVTGAGSGIGRATAIEFSKRGVRLVLADIDATTGEETLRRIKDADGPEAIFLQADVSKSKDVQNIVEQGVEKFGRLDFAHNNAGIDGDFVTIVGGTEENFDHTIGVNLKSVWMGMKYEIPHIRKQKGGAIVNSASVAGIVAYRTMSVYVASKHGVIGLTKAGALECSRIGVRVNAICPGAIRTPMIDAYIQGNPETEAHMDGLQPIGRMGRPEEVAKAVAWLCSEEASFITGAALTIDGGIVCQSGDFPPMPEE